MVGQPYNAVTATFLTTGTSWSSGAITFVTSVPHNLTTGSQVVITGASPAGYNGTFTVTD